MKFSWGSSILPLPVFARSRRQFLQSPKLLLVLGATGTITSLYLLYAGLALVIQRHGGYAAYPIAQKGDGNAINEQQQINTMGFYARDWSLQLGWNNVAYCYLLGLLFCT